MSDDGRQSLDPRGRIPVYGLFLVASVVLGTSVGLLAFIHTMGNLAPWNGVLRLRLPSFTEPDPLGGHRPTVRSTGVAFLLETPDNKRCAQRWQFDLQAESRRWERLAARAGFEVRREREAPDAGAPLRDAVWIVPWSLCLRHSDWVRLDAHLRRGGGAVVGGPVDLARAREPEGPLSVWLSPRTVVNLGRDADRFLMAADRSPPSATLAPGERIDLAGGPDAWGVDAPHPALLWSRWELRPRPAPRGGRLAAAAARRVGQGRLVWFGVPITRAAREGGSGLGRASLLGLQWSAGDTIVALAPWPRGRDHAVVAAVDATGEPRQLRDAARQLSLRGIPATFFWYSDSLDGSQALRPLLGPDAEIASRGDRPVPLAGHPRTEQVRRLARSRQRLEKAGRGAGPVRGVHPPNEEIDELTLHAAEAAGYEYVLGDPDYDRAYPRFRSIGRRGVVVLPRAGVGDDYEHVIRSGQTDPNAVAARFLHDLLRIRELGGLYVLNLRPDLLGDERLRPALDRVLGAAQGPGAWVATARDVAAWARRRAAVQVTLEPETARVVVRNRGREPVEGLDLELYQDVPAPRRLTLPTLPVGKERRLSAGPRVALAP
ncbi:MAG: hypothetical protein ABFS46_06895 [Myxococcota bacterium]